MGRMCSVFYYKFLRDCTADLSEDQDLKIEMVLCSV